MCYQFIHELDCLTRDEMKFLKAVETCYLEVG